MQLGANSGHNSVKTACLGKFWFSQNLGKTEKICWKNEIFRFFSNLAGWILMGFSIQLEANNGVSGWDGDLVFSSSLLGGFSFSVLELFLSVAFVELVYLFIMLMILVRDRPLRSISLPFIGCRFSLPDRIWGLFARLFLEGWLISIDIIYMDRRRIYLGTL